jgi:ATP-dependent DNA helicase RecG
MENQNTEYKSIWRDEYLKWICGFANAGGGKLLIGVDDNGIYKGISNYKELLETLPNKIRDTMGIHAAVQLKVKGEAFYVEIEVIAYDTPISYRGKYYMRNGSTLQELNGTSLYEFLINKAGKTWDNITEPNASLDDININSIKQFISDVKRTGRIEIEDTISVHLLLEKLHLIEKGLLKRAAIVLFAKEPGKFFPNTSVKIGRFGNSDADIKYHQLVEGNLIQIKEQIIETLHAKFFIHPIEFVGLQRIEKNEYPIAAVREMMLNALIHRNYLGSPTLIRIFDNSFSVWNDGLLPEGLTVEDLKRSHTSKPRNPIIADICFKAGYIDTWGRGTIKIIEACHEHNLPDPVMLEQQGGFLCQLFMQTSINESTATDEMLDFLTDEGEITVKLRRNYGENTVKILRLIISNPEIKTSELALNIGKSKSTIEKTIKRMKETQLIERIGSDRAGYWKVRKDSFPS